MQKSKTNCTARSSGKGCAASAARGLHKYTPAELEAFVRGYLTARAGEARISEALRRLGRRDLAAQVEESHAESPSVAALLKIWEQYEGAQRKRQ